MDQACRWVINYLSCLLGNALPNDDIVTSVRMPFTEKDKQWRRRLSACVHCRLAVNILNIIFSHALSIFKLVD